LKRETIAPGVALTAIPADSFKSCRISLNFIVKGDRRTATAQALLPMVMERGWLECPDMQVLSRQLARLYGANLTVCGGTLGPNRTVTVSISGIRDEYAVGGENLLAEYLRLVFGVAFRPDVKDGAFSRDAVRVEKEKLKQLQKSEINDKRIYCLRQARRKFYGTDVAGLEKYGYPEDVGSITPEGLYATWLDMVTTAQLEVMALGVDGGTVRDRLLQELAGIRRQPVALNMPHAMPVGQTRFYEEPVDATQGKLCMLFTQRQTMTPEKLPAMRLAIALLGGTPTSRLFMNVREKKSLCYYCSASFSVIASCLSIDSGINTADAEKTRLAILSEMENLTNQPVSARELDGAVRYLTNALESVSDSLSGLEGWYLSEISRGTLKSPEQVLKELKAVTPQQVTQAMESFSLSVVYLLKGNGTDDCEEEML